MLSNATISGHGPFHRNFLWRTTGFPCELLEQFGIDDLAGEVGRCVAGHDINGGRADTSKLLGRDLTDRFNNSFVDLRRALHAVLTSRRFQNAVACSSPAAAMQLRNGSAKPLETRRSAQKRVELLGMRYLQRFATKCETAAFFGPVAVGCIGANSQRVIFQHDRDSYTGVGYLGAQLLRALLQRLRRDPDVLWNAHVRRRTGSASGADRSIIHPRFGQLWIEQRAAALLASATAPIQVYKLLAGWPDAKTEGLKVILALIEIGALSDDLEGAWHSDDPIGWLSPHVARSGIRAELTALLDLLDDALTGWPSSDAIAKENWLNSLTGAARRADIAHPRTPARFYSDHLPLYEDGFADGIRLCFDEAWAQPFLKDLEKVIRASLARDAARTKALRMQIARRLAAHHQRTMALPDFISEVAEARLAIKIEEPPTDRLSDFRAPAITSPDVLIAAADLASLRRRECTWVLSECHSSVSSAGFFVRPMHDKDRWLSSIDEFLAEQLPGLQLIAIASERWNKTSFGAPLKCAKYLESGLSAPPGTAKIELAEIDVHVDDDLKLTVRGTDIPAVLIPGQWNDAAPLMECFRTPRFEPPSSSSRTGQRDATGSVVYRRARWELRSNGLPPHDSQVVEIFAWVQAQRRAYKLPRWIFARPSVERKPLCIDLSNPFLCEELVRLLRLEPNLSVEEMYPAPGDSWIQGADGRYLGEIRFLYAADGTV